jgi:hypothetical protein
MNTSQVIGNIILERATTSLDTKIIGENAGKVEATGIVQDLGVENRNGRIYELKDIKSEIEGDRFQKELIPTGNCISEWGHPVSQELSRQSVIDPKNSCARFTKLWIEGNDVHANFKGTNTNYGLAFNADLMEGVKPSFSLRALGSVDRERNGKCYVRNIRCITYDTVVFPSHKRAYMTGFVTPTNESAITESANINIDNYTNSKTMFENGILIPIVNQQVVDYIKHESANVKSILNNFDILYESAIIVNDGKKVQLTLPGGDKILVNLEQYITNEIMNYCYNN